MLIWENYKYWMAQMVISHKCQRKIFKKIKESVNKNKHNKQLRTYWVQFNKKEETKACCVDQNKYLPSGNKIKKKIKQQTNQCLKNIKSKITKKVWKLKMLSLIALFFIKKEKEKVLSHKKNKIQQKILTKC